MALVDMFMFHLLQQMNGIAQNPIMEVELEIAATVSLDIITRQAEADIVDSVHMEQAILDVSLQTQPQYAHLINMNVRVMM
jgi:hypothetical protein